MSNESGGRAYFDKRVRFAPPGKYPLANNKLPARPLAHRYPETQLFNPGTDLSTIFKRFPFLSNRLARVPLQNNKAPDELPIFKKKAEIIQTVLSSPVTIIEAPTGSGKSTMVPKFLHEQGLKVTILGPRRLPASELATFGAEMRQEELGDTVGFRHALKSAASSNTRILYSTEGYQLVREVHHPSPADSVIIFDEFHEHTANAETLLGIFKKRMRMGIPVPKIVVMSATLDSQRVSSYFGDVPIIKVEGRRFPVAQQAAGGSIAEDAVKFAKEGLNPLGFFYGKKEIEEQLEQIRNIGTTAKVLPLHSQLPYDQQKLALLPHPEGKIILATNTAQTSLTIPDARAVILSGLVRRLTIDNEGVPSLTIDEISQDEFWQQIGRVGRTSPGIFVSHAKPLSELKRHAPAEIQNMSLEALALRLTAGGEDIRELNRYLYHPVTESHIVQTYTTLHRLGLFGPQGHITDLGRQVAQLPVGVRMGKMLVRAMSFAELYKVDIISHAIDIAAISESEGILSGESRNWRRLAPGNHSSDLLVQMRVFQRALELSPAQRDVFGIDEVNLHRAVDVQEMLRRRLNVPAPEKIAPLNDSQQLWLSRAIIEGYIDSVFRCTHRNDTGDYMYKPMAGGKSAILSKDSVIGGSSIIVGNRFNIGYLDGNSIQRILPLILMATRVDDYEWLEHNAPISLSGDYKEGLSKIRNQNFGKGKERMIARDPRNRGGVR